MSDFLLPVDIANRGLQHVGEKRIAAFTDSSKNASEVNFCYDKLRKAELQRNIWRFAIREAILRPVGATTMKITFAAYDATKTYLVGSCVTSGGILYMANAAVPLATVPGSGNPWVQYFGPLSVSSWGANTNGVNPPNWVNSTTYAAGANVLGSDGNTYKSIANGNINNNPVGDNGVNWTANGTPNKTSYFAGELVYYPTVAPTVVYLSLVSGNTLNPSAVPAFDATITYNNMNTATFGPTIFQSSEDLNLGNTPVPLWLVGTTYAITNQVLASDNNLYSSVAGGNIGFNPVGDLGVHWTLVGAAPWVLPPANQVDQMMGQNWLRLTKASVVSIQIIYPANSGPVEQIATKNIFLLPSGYLKHAPSDPKQGNFSFLGTPNAPRVDDFKYESGIIVSSNTGPVYLRFGADIADVTLMNPMFCEGLGCRVGIEICEALTQSTERLNAIEAQYRLFMTEARLTNGIEIGTEESPLDDWIACRI